MRFDPFYRTPEWRQLRADYIFEHPICETDGCGYETKHVDHRQSIARGGAKLDPRNLRGLCHSCHSRKTAKFDMPGRRQGVQSLGAKGCDAAGRPLDPNHHWNDRGAAR
jgi:5-methylcytosine-specific restriction protein A